ASERLAASVYGEVLLVADEAKIRWHLLQKVMQVCHDEHRLSKRGNIPTELCAASAARLIYGEMGRQKANVDDATIILECDAAVGQRRRWQRQIKQDDDEAGTH